MNMPALKQHDYDWPDTPREDVYQEYNRRKQDLRQWCRSEREYEKRVAELAAELGI